MLLTLKDSHMPAPIKAQRSRTKVTASNQQQVLLKPKAYISLLSRKTI